MRLRVEQYAETAEVRDRLVSVGVCPECHWKLALPDRLYCRACLRRYRLRARVRLGYQGQKRCGECRRRGHDIRSCTRRPV